MNKFTQCILLFVFMIFTVGIVEARGLVQSFQITGDQTRLHGYGKITFPVYSAEFGAYGIGSTSSEMPILDLTVISPPPPYGEYHIYHLRYRVCCELNMARWRIHPLKPWGWLKEMELPEVELFGGGPGGDDAFFRLKFDRGSGEISTRENGKLLKGKLLLIKE